MNGWSVHRDHDRCAGKRVPGSPDTDGPRKKATRHPRLGDAVVTWWVTTASLILILTGIAKLVSTRDANTLLGMTDPIFGMKFSALMVGVGILELAIALICLLGKWPGLALGLIAWLATDFVVYRLGLWWTAWKKPCGCVGNLTDALHLSPRLTDLLAKLLLAYLLVGSYGLLAWRWYHRKQLIQPDLQTPTGRETRGP